MQRGDQADGAVAAHAQIAGIVEEDDSAGGVRRDGLAVKGADQHIIAAWLEQGRAAPLVMVVTQCVALLAHGLAGDGRKPLMTRRVGSPPVWESMTWMLFIEIVNPLNAFAGGWDGRIADFIQCRFYTINPSCVPSADIDTCASVFSRECGGEFSPVFAEGTRAHSDVRSGVLSDGQLRVACRYWRGVKPVMVLNWRENALWSV